MSKCCEGAYSDHHTRIQSAPRKSLRSNFTWERSSDNNTPSPQTIETKATRSNKKSGERIGGVKLHGVRGSVETGVGGQGYKIHHGVRKVDRGVTCARTAADRNSSETMNACVTCIFSRRYPHNKCNTVARCKGRHKWSNRHFEGVTGSPCCFFGRVNRS